MNSHYKKFKKWTEQEKTQNNLKKINLGGLVLVGALLLALAIKNDGFSYIQGVFTRVTPTPLINENIPTNADKKSEITCYSDGHSIPCSSLLTPSPTLVQQKYIAPTVDPDPPVMCRLYSECGGGTTPLRQSECNVSTCCQIGDKWIFYKDKNKCTQDQNNYYKTGTYAYPTYSPLPTYAPAPTYSYPTYQPYATPTLTDSQAQAIIDQHNSQVQQCQNNATSQYAGLIQSCNQYGDSSAADACRTLYEGQRQSAYNSCGSTY